MQVVIQPFVGGLRVFVSNQLLGDGDVAGPWTTI